MGGLQKGFSLLELIVVIVIISVLAVGSTHFVVTSGEAFAKSTRVSYLASSGRIAVERMNREIRNAVPNSVRVGVGANRCVEFLPVVAATSYLDVPETDVDLTSGNTFVAKPFPVASAPLIGAQDVVSVVDPGFSTAGTSYVIVNPTSSDDVYAATDGVRNDFSSIAPTQDTEPVPGSGVYVTVADQSTKIFEAKMADPHQFPAESPTDRIFFSGTPVSYCVMTEAGYDGQLRRFSAYGLNAVQARPPIANSVAISEFIVSTNQIFTYESGPGERNAIVNVLFEMESEGQQLTLHHELQVRNVP